MPDKSRPPDAISKPSHPILRSEAARVLFEWRYADFWFHRKFVRRRAGGGLRRSCAVAEARRRLLDWRLHWHMNEAAPGVYALRVSYE